MEIVVLTGQVYLSPHALGEMWKEEGEKAKQLEDSFLKYLQTSGVSMYQVPSVWWAVTPVDIDVTVMIFQWN